MTGIRTAPDYAPDNVGVWPAVITYPRTGNTKTSEAGESETLHNIAVELHTPLKNLPNDIKILMPFYDLIKNALTEDPWLGELCDAYERITYQFGAMKWAETKTVGFRFIIENLLMYPYGVKGST